MPQPLTQRQVKEIARLDTPRARRQARLFTAEGSRWVLDALDTFAPELVAATPAWLEANPGFLPSGLPLFLATPSQMRQLSTLSTPPGLLALLKMPEDPGPPIPAPDELLLALDDVQDPGNLGTILRTALWMGIRRVVASPATADCFSPKALQATMSAIGRVEVAYTPLAPYIRSLPSHYPVYGMALDGDDIYTTPLTRGGLIVMGNEAHGLSTAVAGLLTRRLRIPSYPQGQPPAVESLNVAVATAITLAEFRRQSVIRHSSSS